MLDEPSQFAPGYGDAVAPGSGVRPLSRRFVDDARVTDHHAIIPTDVARAGKQLGRDEGRVYDLVCRRFLMAWHDDYQTRVTHVVTAVDSEGARDLFRSQGTAVTQLGWKALDPPSASPQGAGASRGGEPPQLPFGLAEGQARPVARVRSLDKQTQPPKAFTDALLLTAMETAGRSLAERELEEAMRERGLGTPATRAAVIETLLARGYVRREGKGLRATGKGRTLVASAHEAVKSPQLTGRTDQ